MLISIVIPIYNESGKLRIAIEELQRLTHDQHQIEYLLVDGGSTDDSLLIAKELALNNPNIYCYCSKKGRSKQLHLGATKAKGELYYFLHIDSTPPPAYDQHIRQALKNGHGAGCFRMQFDRPHWWLGLAGWLTRFNWIVARGGDQSQYITASLYKDLGGYDTTLTIYEDYDLIKRLYKIDQFYVIPKVLTTSARRYQEKGVFTLQWHYFMIHYKKWRGASDDELTQYHQKHC